MKLYEITATVVDRNGVRVDSCNPETLGEHYLSLWSSPSAAEQARSELADDVGDGVDAFTEYTIREHEISIPDGWYCVCPHGSECMGVEFVAEKIISRLSGIVPSDDDTQCDEPVANAITLLTLGDGAVLSSVDVCRREN